MNFNFFKSGSFLNPKSLGIILGSFWEKNRKTCFILFSLMIMSLASYLWYKDLYKSDWSSDRKKQYNNSQNNEVQFKEKEFQRVLQEIEKRKMNYEKASVSVKDIFKPYEGEEKPKEEDTSLNPISKPTF